MTTPSLVTIDARCCKFELANPVTIVIPCKGNSFPVIFIKNAKDRFEIWSVGMNLPDRCFTEASQLSEAIGAAF